MARVAPHRQRRRDAALGKHRRERGNASLPVIEHLCACSRAGPYHSTYPCWQHVDKCPKYRDGRPKWWISHFHGEGARTTFSLARRGQQDRHQVNGSDGNGATVGMKALGPATVLEPDRRT